MGSKVLKLEFVECDSMALWQLDRNLVLPHLTDLSIP